MYGLNKPLGLQPYKTVTGSTQNGQLNEYLIQSNNGTAPGYGQNIFTFDPVMMLNDGTIGVAAPGQSALGTFGGVKYTIPVGQSGIGGPYIFSPYWPASMTVAPNTQITALIMDDPNVVYNIQSSNFNPTSVNAAAIPLGVMASQVNKNANFAIGGNLFTDAPAIVPQNPTIGNIISGQSSYYLDISSISTTSTLSLKILGLTPVTTPGVSNNGPYKNVFYPEGQTGLPPAPNAGQFNNVLVVFNNDVLKGGTGTTSGITNTIQTGAITLVNFRAMSTVPVPLVAAPGAGATLVVNSLVITVANPTTAFTAGGASKVQYGNAVAAGGASASTVLPAAAVTGIPTGTTRTLNYRGVPVDLVARANQALTLSCDTADFAGGNDAVITYTLNYSVIPL